jgi:hypothetical protein
MITKARMMPSAIFSTNMMSEGKLLLNVAPRLWWELVPNGSGD